MALFEVRFFEQQGIGPEHLFDYPAIQVLAKSESEAIELAIGQLRAQVPSVDQKRLEPPRVWRLGG